MEEPFFLPSKYDIFMISCLKDREYPPFTQKIEGLVFSMEQQND